MIGVAACRPAAATPGYAPETLPAGSGAGASLPASPAPVIRASKNRSLYVSPGGSGKICWKALPCSLETANGIARPGDTVLLLAGVYTASIRPAQDGQPDNPIVYRSENRSAVLTGAENCAFLDQRAWIVLQDLRFENCGSAWITATGARHIRITGSYFDHTRRAGYGGIWIYRSAYISLAGNHFGQWGENALVEGTAGYGDAVHLEIIDHALVEDNDFTSARAGHSLLHLVGRYGVLRGNRFQNAWQKDVELVGSGFDTHGSPVQAGPYLVEDNRFEKSALTVYQRKTDGSAEITKGGVGLQTSASSSIIRHNIFAYNQLSGLVASVTEQAPAFTGNHIYHNTFYAHPGGPGLRLASYIPQAQVGGNNVVNNLFVDNGFQENPDARYSYVNSYAGHNRPGPGLQIMFDFYGGLGLAGNRLAGNAFFQPNPGLSSLVAANGIGDADVLAWQNNPLYAASFVDNTVADPRLDLASGDFTLQPGSPVIDRGVSLTRAVQAGEQSTRLQVADAGFFSDGWSMVEADWVQVGDSQPVQITAVDYATQVLTLAEARNWTDGDPVNLYRDSSGRVVLAGPAPDPGASEFGTQSAPN